MPAAQASSTDVSKVIRRVWYAGDKSGYVDLVDRAADGWHAWERATGHHVLHRSGHLSVVPDLAPGSLIAESVRLLHDRGAVEV